MSHMVIYRTGDGQPGYHQADELVDAVKFVERLRNGDGVDSARIFHMEEVNFDFRPYFKVEIGPSGEPTQVPFGDAAEAPAPAPSPPFEPEPMAIPEPEPVAEPEPMAIPEPEPVAAPEPMAASEPMALSPSPLPLPIR